MEGLFFGKNAKIFDTANTLHIMASST